MTDSSVPISWLSRSGISSTSGSLANTLVGWITTPCLFLVWNTCGVQDTTELQPHAMPRPPPRRRCTTDLIRVLAGGVVFIGQSQLRVEASAQQQLQQCLLARGQILADTDRLLQRRHVVTQLELHLLLRTGQRRRTWHIWLLHIYYTAAARDACRSISPVCPRLVPSPACVSCSCLLSLSPTLTRSRPPGPRPSSGPFAWCSPAARDPSSTDAASSSQSASPCAARGCHRRECRTQIPSGHGFLAIPVCVKTHIVSFRAIYHHI